MLLLAPNAYAHSPLPTCTMSSSSWNDSLTRSTLQPHPGRKPSSSRPPTLSIGSCVAKADVCSIAPCTHNHTPSSCWRSPTSISSNPKTMKQSGPRHMSQRAHIPMCIYGLARTHLIFVVVQQLGPPNKGGPQFHHTIHAGAQQHLCNNQICRISSVTTNEITKSA
jgi:hypothetical protein